MGGLEKSLAENKLALIFFKGAKQIEATVYGWPRKNH